jgi:riboflavin synthase
MFTGIIKSQSGISRTSEEGKSRAVWVSTPSGWKLKEGDSVSVDGICSTVKRVRGNSFEVEYMPETLKKTTAALFKKGAVVNLELPLRANDRLDGHLVQGHVDTTGEVKEAKKAGKSVILKVGFPKEYGKFISQKGSVAVNGVSLTVVETGAGWFTVSLVSYTLKHTNLGKLKKGDKVNVEVDVLARYMETLLK